MQHGEASKITTMTDSPNQQARISLGHWTVVDLFSGAGGFSTGFRLHPNFEVLAAVDIELGKPSLGPGTLGCNATYHANLGVEPLEIDLGKVSPTALREALEPRLNGHGLDVLIVCPPCTGLTRAVPRNHEIDNPQNALIDRTIDFVAALRPQVVLMENAREFIQGRFSHHFEGVQRGLEDLSFEVNGTVVGLERFGLPQRRERALVVAAKAPLTLRTLNDIWDGHSIRKEATTVRRAIADLPPVEAGEESDIDPLHASPCIKRDSTRKRLAAIPLDGGSWSDLVGTSHEHLLIPSMKRAVAAGKPNRHGDVYGRLAWDKPAATIKRECSHVGNGRYTHPVQDRLCTIREMAILQGFPRDYVFKGSSRLNMYRHVGNAVPPLIAYQLAWVASWILGGSKPLVSELLMPGGHLRTEDIVALDRPEA
jgi:DNA (cytosine-5)-methyltransferase 1